MFFGRNDVKAETPVLWLPHVMSWLIGKDSDAGRDWGQEEKGTTEDEMAGWHHWLDGREFQWTLGVGDEQGDLVCCDSWCRKESDMTEWLNWTEFINIPSSSLCKVLTTMLSILAWQKLRQTLPCALSWKLQIKSMLISNNLSLKKEALNFMVIFNSQKSCKEYTENFCIYSSRFVYIAMLYLSKLITHC